MCMTMRPEGNSLRVAYSFWWSFCWLLLPFVELLVRLLGYRRSRSVAKCLARALQVFRTRNATAECSPTSLACWFADIVEHAGRKNPLRSRCLARSLLLWGLLEAHRIESEICIGVARRDDSLLAHAWVEYAGVPINDRKEIDRTFGKLSRKSVVQ